MKKNKLYIFILLACFAGYCWLFYSLNQIDKNNFSICLFKNATNLPCPSCGTTRAIAELSKGNFLQSFYYNPFGYVVAFIMVVAPIWIIYDFVFKSNSFYLFYQKTENFIRKKPVAIILILLVALNWYWNIKKDL